jgi:hypothetical protein
MPRCRINEELLVEYLKNFVSYRSKIAVIDSKVLVHPKHKTPEEKRKASVLKKKRNAARKESRSSRSSRSGKSK